MSSWSAFRRALRGVGEVLVRRVVAEAREAFEDLVVAFGEEGERFGVELHGVSSYFVKDRGGRGGDAERRASSASVTRAMAS